MKNFALGNILLAVGNTFPLVGYTLPVVESGNEPSLE